MRNPTPRLALCALLPALCTPLPACSPSMAVTDVVATDAVAAPEAGEPADAPVVPRDVVVDAPPPLRPPPIMRTQNDAALAARRASCAFRAGAWPAETLGTEVPVAEQIPIRHVLVLMQENRSFDHYFSELPRHGQTDVEVAPAGWSNPRTPGGAAVPRFHTTDACVEDPSHSWNGTHTQYHGGMMDGFVTSNEPHGERSMGYLDASDIPFYYDLANTFAIADHYHCSLLGPTWPNRFYMMSATSFGLVNNSFVESDSREAPVDSIFRRFDAAGLEWRDYSAGPRMVAFYPYYGLARRETRDRLRTVDQLMADLSSGNLPAFAFIEPQYLGNGGDRNDEHPPGMPQVGEQWTERLVRAVMASPAWRNIALFITYDEHGGFADHVAPPTACPPDDKPPAMGSYPAGERFDRLGVRVPFFVVSPYARRHFVSHRTYDHTSILRFVEATFGLPAMTARDANATPPMDMFDFANPPFMTPPTLASGRVDPAVQARCRTEFPGGGGF